MVVWAIGSPCSPMIAAKSRKLHWKLNYQRTHSTTISWSKCRPLKSSSTVTNCDICLSSQLVITFAPEPAKGAAAVCGSLLSGSIHTPGGDRGPRVHGEWFVDEPN